MVRQSLALLLLLSAACFPATHELEGRGCDDEHACPGELLCVDSVCLSEVPPPEDPDGGMPSAGLLPNPGFEEGLTGWRPSTDWSVLTLRSNLSMTGRNSARLAVGPDAGTGVMGLASDPPVPATVGQLFCAEAYVSSGANRAIGVQIMNGLNSTSPRDAPGASAIPGVGWARLRTSHVATVEAPGVWVRVTTLSPPQNMVFHADEVRLWSPDAGSCF